MSERNLVPRLVLAAVAFGAIGSAQDRPFCMPTPELRDSAGSCAPRFGNSPFDPPECSDQVFIVDQAPGLDTGCTYRSGGPLLFDIMVDRVVAVAGKTAQDLVAAGLMEPTATLSMPAFDVDFNGAPPPERDRVSFNGHVVPTEFLQGDNGIWRLNAFDIPVSWINFPSDPGNGNQPTPAANTIRIDIDVLSSSDRWCTSIDWAALEIRVVRPVVMVHGILSNGNTWNTSPFSWVTELDSLGWPNDRLDMGALDSIQNNAAKIAARVASARARFGVEAVNLVCHSKGGLDSRHYVEHSDDVAAVVQIGTPNGGSPLADLIQAGLLLTAPKLTILINALATPAGYQLTRPYMAGYNLFHGSNANVDYVALAGDYDPDCFFLNPLCRPLQRLLLTLTGRGDTIVPVSSVHTLGFTSNFTLQSTHPVTDTIHASIVSPGPVAQTNSSSIYDIAAPFLAAATGTPRQIGSPGNITVAPGRRSPFVAEEAGAVLLTRTDTVTSGMTVTNDLTIENGSRTFVLLLTDNSLADLVLVRPNGTVVDPVVAGNDPGIGYSTGSLLGSEFAAYELVQPTGGTWQVRVTGTNAPGMSTDFALAALGEPSPIALAIRNESTEVVRAGQTLTVRAAFTDAGNPVLNATVDGVVQPPTGNPIALNLRDDGLPPDAIANDGIYSGSTTRTGEAGYYRLAATGRTGSRQRTAFGAASVVDGSPAILGNITETPVDTNSNTLFDLLVLSVDVDLVPNQQYRLLGVLSDSQGNELPAQVDFVALGGVETIDLMFDGRALSRNGIDGPYTLDRVRIAQEVDAELLPAASYAAPYLTAAYLASQFERDAIRLTGNGSTVGVDVNSNQLFDFLDVGVEVEVDTAGFYSWSARLVDSRGQEVDFVAGSGSFQVGANTMVFRFDGREIGMNGVAGPWFVRELLVYGAGLSLVEPRAFMTEFLPASAFEGFVGVPPGFGPTTPCGAIVQATVNQVVQFGVEALDADLGDVVMLTAQNLPSGARILEPLPAFGNPVAIHFDWIPSSSQVGSFPVDFLAIDVAGQMTECRVTVAVQTAPNNPPFVSSIPNGGLFEATVGNPFVFAIEFDSGDPGQGFQSIEVVAPGLANLQCAPPTLGPVGRIECQFTPDPNQLGVHIVQFIATDADPVNPLSVTVPVRFDVAECYLLVGLHDADTVVLGGIHMLVQPLAIYPVTTATVPTFMLPPGTAGLTVRSQVVMNNPVAFPTNPLQWTPGLATTIGGGSVLYGTGNGLQIHPVGSGAPGTTFTIGFTFGN
ncbi:MAG: hypothetical protein KDE27_06760 [Planctomycetes bacterium]|nr:hypothetical protein [Planctomycetota bacterium]